MLAVTLPTLFRLPTSPIRGSRASKMRHATAWSVLRRSARVAYLADLLDYTVRHVRAGDRPVTLPDLASLLHQPFGDLPTSCESAEALVRQVRLAVEVLRSLLDHTPYDPALAERVRDANGQYARAAYEALLLQVGTSYDALRLALHGSAAERKDLAEKLAITPPGNIASDQRIAQLWLDQDKAYPDLQALNEISLARLFGLRPTMVTSRFSRGVKLGDSQDQLRGWQLSGVVWRRNTDENGRVHLRLTASGTTLLVKLYRSQAKNDETLVASGSRTGNDGPVPLAEENFSGLFGTLTVHYTTPTGGIAISAIPDFLSWRLAAMRQQWLAEAYPKDNASLGASPVIDPDLIGPDDFRRPAPGSPAFDIWLTRREWIDGRLNEMRSKTKLTDDGLIMPDVQQMLDVMADHLPSWYGMSMADLAALRDSMQTPSAQNAATSRLERLFFSPEGFVRLMEIIGKSILWESGTGDVVSDDEWEEVYAILVQVQKQAAVSSWRSQERSISETLLSQEHFWPPLQEPLEGVWPPKQPAGQPWIDPDTVREDDLPEADVNVQARLLLQARTTQLIEIYEQLKDVHQAGGLEALFTEAFGAAPAPSTWHDELDRLNEERMSSDATVVDAARQRITGDLHLQEAEFSLLMTGKAKDAAGQADSSLAPKPEEWAPIYTMLTRARKKREIYPVWIAEENDEDLPYWACRKARLPRWRADANRRRRWREALQSTARLPVIDPDLVGIPDFITPVSADAAFRAWEERSAGLLSLKQKFPNVVGASASEKISNLLRFHLDLTPERLDALAEASDAGALTPEILAQLTVTRQEWNTLLRIRRLAGAGPSAAPLGDEEWENLYDILVQVEKRRRFYPQWHLEERDLGLAISPDHFKMREPEAMTGTSPPQNAFSPWRARPNDRRGWENQLKARIDQHKSIVQALDHAVTTAEEAALPSLRDALIAAMNAPGTPLAEAAKETGQRLLIDMAGSGCQMTTRVAQAVATVQSLLWSLRTGQNEDAWPDLSLDAEAFDEEWKWLGAYAAWRAAMFVFLYPENVLWPGLRRRKTGAFAGLADSLRSAVDLLEHSICEQVRRYSIYFKDVTALSVEATCMARVRRPAGRCNTDNGAPNGDTALLFMFGRGPSAGKVYSSAYDPEDPSDTPQTLWDEVPGIDAAVRILGARVRRLPDGTRHLYLFTLKDLEEGRRLFVSRCNLDQDITWQSGEIRISWQEPEPLEGPAFQWDAVMRQINSEDRPVEFLSASGGKLYCSSLNDSGNGWRDDGWKPFSKKSGEVVEIKGLPVAFVNNTIVGYKDTQSESIGPTTWNNTWHFLDRNQNPPEYENPAYQYAGFINVGYTYVYEWLGAWPEPGGEAFIFYRNQSSGEARYRNLLLPDPAHENIAPAGMERIALHCGGGTQGCMAYRSANDGTNTPVTVVRTVDRLTLDKLSFGNDNLAAPEIPAPVITTGNLAGFDEDIFWWTVTSLQNLDARWSWSSNFTYLDEAFYYVPLQIALELQQRGRYVEALDWFRNIYDYTQKGRRVLYAGLDNTWSAPNGADAYVRGTDWLLDPLNPHTIAAVRPDTDLRFVLMSLIRCLIAYGDDEFARDTAESLPRARRLYELAIDLLENAVLARRRTPCEEMVSEIQKQMERLEPQWRSAFSPLAAALREIGDTDRRRAAAQALAETLTSGDSMTLKLQRARQAVGKAMAAFSEPQTLSRRLKNARQLAKEGAQALLSNTGEVGGLNAIADRWGAADGEKTAPTGYTPIPSMGFCIQPNPILTTLRYHAELNLYKLRTCRNISGMTRETAAYAAPTGAVGGMPAIGAGGQITIPGAWQIRPTQYRYRVLAERAKQLVGIAQQMEAALLSLIEKADAERYNLLKARQDARMARAGVQLQEIRVQESEGGVALATLQQERAAIQEEHFAGLLQGEGLSDAEIAGLTLMATSGVLQGITALGYFALAGPAAVVAGSGAFVSGFGTLGGLASSPTGVGAAGGGIVAGAGVMALGAGFMAGAPMILSGLQAAAGAAGTFAGYALTLANFERRRQEWEFQRQLSGNDIRIAAQQLNIAGDRVRIAGQEREIARLQADHTDEVVEFLNTKFTSIELYDWMSGVLENIYRYFLQQATGMARLAENQLAFERQEIPPALIQANYWDAPRGGGAIDAGTEIAPDRRGLTGASRLLQDIYRLEQYAFETERRKLQLTKTISLARLDPFAFQQLRETGVMVFATPMALFDRDFPGHYLRLINRVRTSVIALVPPVEGVKATLSTAGISRVVIGGDLFQTTLIHREPESVALTSPYNATGLFELEAQGRGEMLLPFEGLGVDTVWEFRMPRPANAFDFNTIADVLVTLDYTALDSPTYRQQVIRQLDLSMEAERAFSLRHQFPDAWYDLHHPDLVQAPQQPMRVSFATRLEDFPPNVTDLRIAHVSTYITRKPGVTEEFDINLNFANQGGTSAVGGVAATANGAASTRQGGGNAWTAMIGKPPSGTWNLALQDTPESRQLFEENQIEDILLVITFRGTTEAWPN